MPDFGNNPALMTPAEIALAKERGRMKAAENIIGNPEARARVEARYGVEFCMRKWPEAYAAPVSIASLWSNFVHGNFGVGAFRRRPS